MSKQKMNGYEMDDGFIAQLNFLRSNHDNALLIEWDILISGSIRDHYIRSTSEIDPDEAEELPFN